MMIDASDHCSLTVAQTLGDNVGVPTRSTLHTVATLAVHELISFLLGSFCALTAILIGQCFVPFFAPTPTLLAISVDIHCSGV